MANSMTPMHIVFRAPRTALAALLLAGSAIGLATGASARVGVTSATDGDPLGKPPTEAERILRVGIDVQADELITTKANDRAHLLFLDGTSLTVGPEASIKIDKFIYDPDSKKGTLEINAVKGVFRLVGGKISKTSAVQITTPSSTIGIRGGITIVDVKPNVTTSTFVFGNNLSVTGHGITQIVTRPGSQVTTNNGSAPGVPTIVPRGGLRTDMGQLENQSRSPGTGGRAGPALTGGGGPGGGPGNFDRSLQVSGFQNTNSRQGVFDSPVGGKLLSINQIISSVSNGVSTNTKTNGNPNGASNGGGSDNGNNGNGVGNSGNGGSNGNGGGNGNSSNNGRGRGRHS